MIIFNTFENIFTTDETSQNEETIEEDSRDLNSYSVFFDILDNIQQINNQSPINIHFFKNKDAFNNIVEVNATKQVIKNIDFEFKKGVFKDRKSTRLNSSH